MMLTSNRRKKALTATILLALTFALIPVFMSNVKLNAAAPDASVEFRPQSSTYFANQTSPGFIFIVNATVVNVTDLQLWQIAVTWNATVLDFVNITLPSDNVFAASGKAIITPSPDNSSGYVKWGATYINGDPGTPDYWTFNGTGTLCQIAFRIRVPTGAPPWTSDLTFASLGTDTFILNGAGLDIPFAGVDGSFAYYDFLAVTLSPLNLYFANYSESVAFTATGINGSLPYSYRWYFKYPNGTEVEATEAVNFTSWGSYPITEFGDYQVTVNVTDSVGVQLNASTIVRLKVLSVAISPEGAIVNVNDMRTFTATASGGITPYKIQWDRNGTEINSAENQTTVSLAFTTVGTETVRVNVTDSELKNVTASAGVKVYSTPTTIVGADSKIFYTNTTLFNGDETFTFNVTIQGVTDLQNWQVHIRWDPTLLAYVDITLPSDNVFAGAARSPIIPPPLVDVDGGGVTFGATYINDPYWTFNGTGTLCQLQLQLLHQPLAQTISPVSIVSQYADAFILDGLGFDIPYNIVNGTYNYVLVSPVTHNVFGNTVLTYTNASILANNVTVILDTKSITFMVNGPTGTGGWVNVTIPKTVMNGTHSIFVNAVNVTATGSITSDAINWYVYIEFSFSSATTIRIQGTQVVPEQMPLLIVALLMASLIAVIFAKVPPRKRLTKE